MSYEGESNSSWHINADGTRTQTTTFSDGSVITRTYNGDGLVSEEDYPNNGGLNSGGSTAHSPAPGEPNMNPGGSWTGWGQERIAGAAVGVFEDMTDLSGETLPRLSSALGGMANDYADQLLRQFPELSQRAMSQTETAVSSLTEINNQAMFASLDSLVPTWRQDILGQVMATGKDANALVDRFYNEVLPSGMLALSQVSDQLGAMAYATAGGALPTGVSEAAFMASPRSYVNATGGRSLRARDLGLTSDSMRQLGSQITGLQSSLIGGYAQKAFGVLGLPSQFAGATANILKPFTPEIVDSATLYGNAMQALGSANDIKPSTIYQVGSGAYANNVQTGMDLYKSMLDLATAQQMSYNNDLTNREMQ